MTGIDGYSLILQIFGMVIKLVLPASVYLGKPMTCALPASVYLPPDPTFTFAKREDSNNPAIVWYTAFSRT